MKPFPFYIYPRSNEGYQELTAQENVISNTSSRHLQKLRARFLGNATIEPEHWSLLWLLDIKDGVQWLLWSPETLEYAGAERWEAEHWDAIFFEIHRSVEEMAFTSKTKTLRFQEPSINRFVKCARQYPLAEGHCLLLEI